MTVDDGVTGIAELNDLLDAYRVPPGSRATLLEAVAAVERDGLTILGRSSSNGVVSLTPVDGLTAVVASVDRVRLVLERRAAVRASQEHEFCRLADTASSAGGRSELELEQWSVQQHAVVVRGLVVAALRAAAPRPERGPRRPGGGATRAAGRAARTAEPVPVARPAVCPVHFVQLINGRCDYCD